MTVVEMIVTVTPLKHAQIPSERQYDRGGDDSNSDTAKTRTDTFGATI